MEDGWSLHVTLFHIYDPHAQRKMTRCSQSHKFVKVHVHVHWPTMTNMYTMYMYMYRTDKLDFDTTYMGKVHFR